MYGKVVFVLRFFLISCETRKENSESFNLRRIEVKIAINDQSKQFFFYGKQPRIFPCLSPINLISLFALRFGAKTTKQ